MSLNLDKTVFLLKNGLLYKSCISRLDSYRQGLCMNCRECDYSSSIFFNDGILLKNNGIIVPEIRILPLSTEIFNSYDEVFKFFTEKMPSRGNTYYYKSHNLKVNKNTMILFQYDKNIIAYAFYESESRISEEDPYYAEGYRGYYIFTENSIRVLSSPISSNTMRERLSINLSQATHRVKPESFSIIMELLTERCDDEFLEENNNIDQKIIKEIAHFFISGIHSFGTTNRTFTKDFISAQKNQMAVGKLGEELVFKYEKECLRNLGREDLSKRVTIVSADTSLGYDILSFDSSGREIHIEVKSKVGICNYLDFYISDNEFTKIKNNKNHIIYYLSNIRSQNPLLFKLTGDMINSDYIRPVLYRVTLDYKIEEV